MEQLTMSMRAISWNFARRTKSYNTSASSTYKTTLDIQRSPYKGQYIQQQQQQFHQHYSSNCRSIYTEVSAVRRTTPATTIHAASATVSATCNEREPTIQLPGLPESTSTVPAPSRLYNRVHKRGTQPYRKPASPLQPWAASTPSNVQYTAKRQREVLCILNDAVEIYSYSVIVNFVFICIIYYQYIYYE